jgi:2',3'-cyclic-nucleotide 2'-phosphodiesterase
MRILFVGDVFGQAGRKIVHDHYHHVVESREVDLSIVNVENAAGGFGVTPQIAEEFFDLGADVLTTGNHVWDKKEIFAYLKTGTSDPASRNRRLLRPGNYPDGTPGFGWFEGQTRGGVLFGVINLQGRVFMTQNDDPFRKADELLQKIRAKVVLVDFHAEATSEKVAMGWYLDGRVTAVLGTHTHVPTADTRVLPGGTAYQTDVGMSGPFDSVIGVEKELVLGRFLSSLPGKFEAAKGDPRMCAVVIDCDATTGKARTIDRLMLGE